MPTTAGAPEVPTPAGGEYTWPLSRGCCASSAPSFSRGNDLARAIDYMLTAVAGLHPLPRRRPDLPSNTAAERALRALCSRQKARWLFARSNRGGRRACGPGQPDRHRWGDERRRSGGAGRPTCPPRERAATPRRRRSKEAFLPRGRSAAIGTSAARQPEHGCHHRRPHDTATPPRCAARTRTGRRNLDRHGTRGRSAARLRRRRGRRHRFHQLRHRDTCRRSSPTNAPPVTLRPSADPPIDPLCGPHRMLTSHRRTAALELRQSPPARRRRLIAVVNSRVQWGIGSRECGQAVSSSFWLILLILESP